MFPAFTKKLVVLFLMAFIGLGSFARAQSQTGSVPDYPIDTRLFTNPKDYFKSKIPRTVYQIYKAKKSPPGWSDNTIPPDEAVAYAAAGQGAALYVPASYNNTKSFGLYLHISPGNRGVDPSPEWRALMDKLNLIYISPHNTQNGVPMWRRVALAMDSMATVKAHYKIDNIRVYVGGLSGGGHMAMMCQMLYPEYFQAAISHAAQSYLPDIGGSGHFPGLTLRDVDSADRKKKKWVVISGDKDFNYAEIRQSSEKWKAARFDYRFIDVPGMGHENASAKALEDALAWAGAAGPSPRR